MNAASARIETPMLDARSSGAPEIGKGRAGQDGGDAFGGLLAEIVSAGAKAPVDTDDAGGPAMTATSFAVGGTAPSGKHVDNATPAASQSLPGKLFQSLVDRTADAETSANVETSEDDIKLASPRDPAADPAVAAMLAMPALAAAIAPAPADASPGTAGTKGSGRLATSIATGTARDDEPLAPITAGDTPPISDVNVETHIAVAASQSVQPGDLETVTHQAESKREPMLPADALQAMAAPTRSVVQAVDTLLPQGPTSAQPADPAPTPLAPARTMNLQLNPADLGTVQVRLHLTGQALDLQLSVSSKETLGVISRDRTHLESALAGQNYDLRSLVIQSADGAAAASKGDAQGDGQGGATQGGQSGGGQGDGSQNRSTSASGNGAGGSGGERRSTPIGRHPTDEAARAPGASRAGALFV